MKEEYYKRVAEIRKKMMASGEYMQFLPSVYPYDDSNASMEFPNNYFDLITSFGVLHHIPDVSKVFSELSRVLAPGGYLLIREPIVSMGDWSYPRK